MIGHRIKQWLLGLRGRHKPHFVRAAAHELEALHRGRFAEFPSDEFTRLWNQVASILETPAATLDPDARVADIAPATRWWEAGSPIDDLVWLAADYVGLVPVPASVQTVGDFVAWVLAQKQQ